MTPKFAYASLLRNLISFLMDMIFYQKEKKTQDDINIKFSLILKLMTYDDKPEKLIEVLDSMRSLPDGETLIQYYVYTSLYKKLQEMPRMPRPAARPPATGYASSDSGGASSDSGGGSSGSED